MLYNGEIFAVDVAAIANYEPGFVFFDAERLANFDC